MDKKQFADAVARPRRFTSQDRAWLRAVLSKYPHSSVVSTLALLADHAYGFDTPEQRRAVALAMCSPDGLDAMLANVAAEEPSFDILDEINNIQEVSFKTAPKSVILSNFLQVDASESPASEPDEAPRVETTEKKSLKADVSLGTETLAVILEKQGRYDKALAIYKNLLAQNPEKSSTFAPRIERLEGLVKNNK